VQTCTAQNKAGESGKNYNIYDNGVLIATVEVDITQEVILPKVGDNSITVTVVKDGVESDKLTPTVVKVYAKPVIKTPLECNLSTNVCTINLTHKDATLDYSYAYSKDGGA